ncbi:TatD family hydrolase [Alkalihalobacterium alkalinitrilicum]|uniref:TatD family hydrolase n=1 Tax=Alkalihalobacterium alkalinitrilicum TaxID=427920 RepID=UPI00099549AF|nr:TatD family hydrolase [Alkalihalobacterium alkalinitrilicum]
MIDSHIHLYQYDQVEKRMNQWLSEGIHKVVAVSNDLKSAYETLELKQRFPNFILAGVGYHPEQKPMQVREMNEFINLIYSEKKAISLIGEVGLPYYELNRLTEREQDLHLEQFAWWVEIARRENLPLAIHAVHSQAERALAILKKVPTVSAHFHWLKAPVPVVQEIVAAGHFISFTPEICYRERDQKLAEIVPLTQLLIETDGPWPYNGPFEQLETTPLLLKHIAKKLIELKNEPHCQIVHQTVTNTIHLYR